MTWIRLDQTLPDHPKIVALEGSLQVEDPWRFLVYLWFWCLEHRDNGIIGRISNERLARAAHWSGDADQFVEALEGAGLLVADDTQGWVVHNWLHYQGRLYNDRERKRNERKRKRERREQASADCPRTVRGQSLDSPASTGNGKRIREEWPSKLPFPLRNGEGWFISEAKFLEYEDTFASSLNVSEELKKAAQWLRDNPKKRKTAGGMYRFLGSWLTRATERSGSAPKTPAAMENQEKEDLLAADRAMLADALQEADPPPKDPEKFLATKARRLRSTNGRVPDSSEPLGGEWRALVEAASGETP